ncbi:LysR family transcriptional regulator [Sorangium sp. So ce385]|uniref:LysR family transcriptional regulator n=1 Tax=Sorangium sp. So ce385 TaxID=3133308 RepID=UPI003F5B1270
MDLNLLSMFIAVVEASSFSTAAMKLGLRRSSVSRGIAALERSLDVQLFSRTTRHVALTTAGAALHAKVAPQLASLHQALGTLPERDEQPSGDLRVTAPNDIGTVILPGILASFSRRYPAIRLDVRLTGRRVDLVAEGFDAALRLSLGRLSDSSLIARKLSDVEIQFFAAPAYLARAGTPRTAKDTATHEWVLLKDMNMSLPVVIPKEKAHVGDDILFICQAVRAGMGLGALPAFLVRDDVAEGRLSRVLPQCSHRSGALYLVHPPSQHVPRKVTALRDHLVEHFAANPLAGVAHGRRGADDAESRPRARAARRPHRRHRAL